MRAIAIVLAALLGALGTQGSLLAFLVLDTRLVQPGRLPDGWRIKVNRGTPDISLANDDQGRALRMKCRNASFGLERSIDVDPAQYPYLGWKWKVTELPAGGDFRRSRSDDQAAQLLVAFDDHRILTYLWDTSAPQGLMQSASSIPLVHIYAVVCRSGARDLNQWLSETRNVAQDYQKAYGRSAPRMKGIRLQINSQHTGTSAESYFGEVGFRNSL